MEYKIIEYMIENMLPGKRERRSIIFNWIVVSFSSRSRRDVCTFQKEFRVVLLNGRSKNTVLKIHLRHVCDEWNKEEREDLFLKTRAINSHVNAHKVERRNWLNLPFERLTFRLPIIPLLLLQLFPALIRAESAEKISQSYMLI